MHPKNSSALLLALVTLASCAKVNDLHEATMKMSETTTKLQADTQETKALIDQVLDQGRQGSSLDLRKNHFEKVLDAKTIEEKSANAGFYFLAFEYQLWNNLGSDYRAGQRDLLMRDAAEEFFTRLLAISHWDGVDPYAGKNVFAFGSTENEKMAFNALAIALDRVNRKQHQVGGVPTISMVDMIETSLLAGKKIRAGQAQLSDYPDFVEQILAHEKLAITLMQARYQMMGVVVLTQLTPIAKNLMEGFKYKILGSSWDLDVTKLNDAELRLAKFRLAEAARARALLAELGVNEQLDASTRKIYNNARVKNAGARVETLSADMSANEGNKSQQAFLSELSGYLK